jgi:hypothetical protein
MERPRVGTGDVVDGSVPLLAEPGEWMRIDRHAELAGDGRRQSGRFRSSLCVRTTTVRGSTD